MAILAKSDKNITLKKHLEDLFQAFSNIEKFVPENLKEILKIAIFFHDIGKVMPAFQIKEVGNKDYSPWDISYEIPHSFFSVFWIDLDKINNDYKTFLISSIAYHHWRESYENFLRNGSKEFIEFCKKSLEWKNELLENIKMELKNYNNFLKFIRLNERWLQGIINGRSFANYAVPPYKFDYEPLRQDFNKKWVLISGFLQRCDHFASFVEENKGNLDDIEIENIKNLRERVKIKLKEKTKKDENFWQFDKVKDTNLILIAPTGYGKTEYAFLWSNAEKIIYTLPLRSAVNQTFKRAEEIFSNGKVGLLHSDADIFLLKPKEEEKEEITSSRIYDLSRQLSCPVIISTGDQFFPYALRPPLYEKIYATLSYSKLIVDEVQAYDPKACAIIVKFIEDTVKMGGKFLLMTATLPDFVKKEIQNRLKNKSWEEINLYEEEKNSKNPFKETIRHKIKIEEIEPKGDKEYGFQLKEEILEKIIDEAKKGKRVLVILNTIQYAQNVYEQLRDKIENSFKLFLLHSKFTFEDRKNKEVELIEKEFGNPKPSEEKEPKILVATQVIEASLDIDADILFTEIAPLDALVQRMGRVLRRIRADERKDLTEKEPNVYILFFKEEEGSENKDTLESGRNRIYNKELLKLTLNKLKENGIEFKLSEYEKYKIVENFFASIPIDSEYLKEFYNTIDILDSGYMSDKKQEALEIFRDIYTVPAVAKEKKDEFKKAIEEFLKNENINYTKFKIDVLSKFVVDIDIRKYFYNNILNLEDASFIAYEIKCEEEKFNKIKRWLKRIYIFDGNYDSILGVFFGKKAKEKTKKTSILQI